MIKGFAFFGDIVAESDKVDCLFISKENVQKIPTYELLRIKEFCEKRNDIQMLTYLYTHKYKLQPSEYASFYGP